MAKQFRPDKSLTDKMVMIEIARKLVGCIFNYFAFEEKTVKGRDMPKYSKEYGKRKRGKEFNQQSDAWSQTRAPILTGAFMQDLQKSAKKVKSGEWGFEIGWLGGEGYKGIALNKMGRHISTSDRPVPIECENKMYENYSLSVDKDWKKMSKKTIAKIKM
tara:strand:- start:2407 stop:2886 length:480 start_codon:yes stop_codon:yes gene_type:complete